MEQMTTIKPGDVVRFEYTNWRGETASRKVVFIALQYGNNSYHNETCWMLHGFDCDRQAVRSFPLHEIKASSLEI